MFVHNEVFFVVALAYSVCQVNIITNLKKNINNYVIVITKTHFVSLSVIQNPYAAF